MPSQLSKIKLGYVRSKGKRCQSHLVIYVSDIHYEVNIVAEVINKNASDDILCYVVSW